MDAEKMAIAAHMYIALRREAKRTIDVEWLLKNAEYAREVVALAKQHSLELAGLAEHFEAWLPGQQDHKEISAAYLPAPQEGISDRYIGRLR